MKPRRLTLLHVEGNNPDAEASEDEILQVQSEATLKGRSVAKPNPK